MPRRDSSVSGQGCEGCKPALRRKVPSEVDPVTSLRLNREHDTEIVEADFQLLDDINCEPEALQDGEVFRAVEKLVMIILN